MPTERLVLQIDQVGGKKAAHALDQVSKSGDRAAASTKRLGGQVIDARSKFRAMRGSTAQLGMQLQDVAIQAQMGTNALVILGQQGSQVASLFGPGGALLGAFIAIAAAIANVFMPRLFESEEAVNELEDALDTLGNTFERTESGAMGLSQRIQQLAKDSRELAEINIALGIASARVAMEEAMQEMVSQVGELTEGFDRGGRAFINFRNQLRRGGDIDPGLESVRDKVNEIAKQFGLSTEQALNLAVAFTTFRQNRSEETIDNLAEVLAGMAGTLAESANPEFRRLVDTLSTNMVLVKEQTATLERFENILDGSADSAERLNDALAGRDPAQEAEAQRVANEQLLQAERALMDEFAVLDIERLDKKKKLEQEANEERLRLARENTERLLEFEDTLLSGKSESTRQAARLAINLADAEKRENAAQIISDSYAAAMKAYKALSGINIIGPALGAAAAGTIIAAGVSFSAKSLTGRALGGQVRPGESYVVGERGPEVLTMGGAGGRIATNESMRSGGGSLVYSPTVNITGGATEQDRAIFTAQLRQQKAEIADLLARRRF